MNHSQPLKDINNAILTNQQIQAAYKKAIESNAGTQNDSYINAFRSLFYLLDECSVQDRLDLNIQLSGDHFSVVDKGQSIPFFEHLLSLYSLGGECEIAWNSEGLSPELSSAIEKAILEIISCFLIKEYNIEKVLSYLKEEAHINISI